MNPGLQSWGLRHKDKKSLFPNFFVPQFKLGAFGGKCPSVENNAKLFLSQSRIVVLRFRT